VCQSPQGCRAHIADVHCSIYGTEAIELNEALRDRAVGFASKAKLNDSALAVAYRAKYASISAYAAATTRPSVVACDVATSDVYYSGNLLSEAVENVTKLYTNGSAVYCTVSAHSRFYHREAQIDQYLDSTRR
jgi:purine nucleoside permease